MSEEIYNRAMIREKTIWPSFFYNISNTDIENTKAIIFGLYANTYLLGRNYLEDIETEELQRLIDIYDSNMAELDMDEQSLVLKIASDRYLKAIEIQIKNDALTTKRQQLVADEQEYEAKLAALDVDQEALETKRAQIELARDRAELKNKDLEARIKLEELAQDYVAVEISQKQLEVARAELSVLMTALKGLEIQISIANVSLQITQAEVSKSQLDADIAGIEARIAGQNLSPKQLEIDQAELDAMQYEIDNVTTKKIELIEAKGDIIEDETTNIETLESKETEIETVQTNEQNAGKQNTLSGFNDRESMAGTEKEQSNYDDNLNIGIAGEHKDSQINIATKKTLLPDARTRAAATRKTAAITAAQIMATANITSTLTHEIGSA